MTITKCNAHVIDRFNSEMTELIDRFTGNYDAGVQTIEIGLMNLGIRIDGKSYVWSDSVRTGRLFRRLPREIHRMKI